MTYPKKYRATFHEDKKTQENWVGEDNFLLIWFHPKISTKQDRTKQKLFKLQNEIEHEGEWSNIKMSMYCLHMHINPSLSRLQHNIGSGEQKRQACTIVSIIWLSRAANSNLVVMAKIDPKGF